MPYIIIFILVEAITCKICAIKNSRLDIDSYLNIYDEGFKYKGNLEDFAKEFENTIKTRELIVEFFFNLIPILNLFFNKFKNEIVKDDLFLTLQNKNMLLPLSMEEKKTYASLKNTYEKVTYASFINYIGDDAKLVGFDGLMPVISDCTLIMLRYDRLNPIGYTLNDIMTISSFLGFHYTLGKVDGINTAILSKNKLNGNRILKENDSLDNIKDFDKMDPNSITNEKFIVYPYDDISDKEQELDALIRRLYEERHTTYNTNSSLDKPLIRQRSIGK